MKKVVRFSWFRLIAGVLIGAACALIVSWIYAPEWASDLAFEHTYEEPETLTLKLYLYDMLFSFIAFICGSLFAYLISRSRPFLTCFLVGLIGWVFYWIEAEGFAGLLSGEHPLWYELAPIHWGASFLVAKLVTIWRDDLGE